MSGCDLVEALHRLEPVTDRHDAEAFAGEPDGQRLHEARLVLDDEHHRLRVMCLPTALEW